MISVGDFRKGITVEIDGQVWNVVDFQHVKPGKGAAFVRTKLKNVMTGSVLERTFNPTEKYPRAMVERKDMRYLYSDGDLYYFMDMESYEQLPLNHDIVEDALPYMKENMNISIRFYKGSLLGGSPQLRGADRHRYRPRLQGRHRHVRQQARHAGDRRKVTVPLFVNVGDVIKVDTRTGEYMERM